MTAGAREKRKQMAKQMTLGQLIDALERKDPKAAINYAFGYFCPTHFMSWRGDYSHIALGYGPWTDIGYHKRPTVADVLTKANESVGKEFTGYKGGEYVMDRETRLWVANNGEACNTGIVDVIEGDMNDIYLVTSHFAY
jgi:hypothetical protein